MLDINKVNPATRNRVIVIEAAGIDATEIIADSLSADGYQTFKFEEVDGMKRRVVENDENTRIDHSWPEGLWEKIQEAARFDAEYIESVGRESGQ